MGFTITAQDSQFAVASGANLNIVPGSSQFDTPPVDVTDLSITTLDADPDPRLFEIGDTYDLSFRDQFGTLHTISGASVTRSDSAGAGGVIVFDGQDQLGDTYHLIWTPDFDLQGWYDANNPPTPQFFITDQNPAYTHSFICFAGQTRIATPEGSKRAGQLRAGDLVNTWNGPPRPVVWTGRRRVAALGAGAPVVIPAGVLGNGRPLRLSRNHRVMLRVPPSATSTGAPEVLVPAKSLIGHDGVAVQKGGEITYVHILLDRHDLLVAEGAPCESLLAGPEARQQLARWYDIDTVFGGLGSRAFFPARPCLDGQSARKAVRKRLRKHAEPLAAAF